EIRVAVHGRAGAVAAGNGLLAVDAGEDRGVVAVGRREDDRVARKTTVSLLRGSEGRPWADRTPLESEDRGDRAAAGVGHDDEKVPRTVLAGEVAAVDARLAADSIVLQEPERRVRVTLRCASLEARVDDVGVRGVVEEGVRIDKVDLVADV